MEDKMREKDLEVRIVNSEEDFNIFWNMYYEYMKRDIFPNDELGLKLTEEDKKWFFSLEYKDQMEKLFARKIDTVYPVFFLKDKNLVGFSTYCTFHSEDGKCLIIDYCILPEFRNNKLGTEYFKIITDIEKSKGAKYFELNVSNRRNMNFWLKQGFYFNGLDEYGAVKLTTNKDDILLIEVDESNWTRFNSLKLSEEQQNYVASPIGILARAYVYRKCNAKVFGIQKGDNIIGMLMVRDINEEPVCYELQQFMIDVGYQNQGYGYKALKLILDYLYVERRYENVEVCVKKEDTKAIHLYKKIGFKGTGYIDPDVEDSYNFVFSFKDLDEKFKSNREK